MRVSIRCCSRYVEKVRLMDYWKLHDEALQREFIRSQFVLMVDKRPLVTKGSQHTKLVEFSYKDLRSKLGEYGVTFEIRQSSLLDAVPDHESSNFIPLFGTAIVTENPPEDSPIQKDQIIKRLADCLNGRFVDVRRAMLTMGNEEQRNRLATFQSLSRWSHIFLRCPKCSAGLKMRISKSGAECIPCRRVYYPTFSPVAITLVRDPTNSHCLLVRHRGSINGVYTCVAGFATSGEPLLECARREIAEEVGLEVSEVKSLGTSQPWPMPDSSLMCAHIATADMNQMIEICPDELETARWFSREEVKEAIQRTIDDPYLKGIKHGPEHRQEFQYIPPAGAIAHGIIKDWAEGRV